MRRSRSKGRLGVNRSIDLLWNIADDMTRSEEGELERLMGKQAFQHSLDKDETTWIRRMMKKYPWCKPAPKGR
jgi:hypothetical protein